MLDQRERIREIDETNNAITLPYEGVRQPDFRINSFTWKTIGVSTPDQRGTSLFETAPYAMGVENPVVGEVMEFTIEIENIGASRGTAKIEVSAPSAQEQLIYYHDDRVSVGAAPTLLASGTTRTKTAESFRDVEPGETVVSRGWIFHGASIPLTFTAEILFVSLIPETNLTNNVKTVDVPALLLPELVITSFVEAPHATLPGFFTYTVTVENTGPGVVIPRRNANFSAILTVRPDSGASPRAFTETLTSSGFFFIPVGGVQVFTFEVQTDGTETVQIAVDRYADVIGQFWANNYIESDERGNILTLVRPAS
jgi:hypothetical protein